MPMPQTLPELRIIKPQNTELVHRVYSPAPNHYAMAFGVMVPFVLHPPQGGHAIEPGAIWDVAAKVLSKDDILDEGWPKPLGEFLVAGNCYCPADHTAQPVAATVSVGGLTKRLAVFGDRHVTATGGISTPQPFDSMPITANNAFGGKDYPANPLGKGLDEQNGIKPLPNIEYPGHLMVSPSDRPPPAGFGPLSAAVPQRARFMGRQDEHWRKNRWPHLPQDTDARYFQAAPEDQQLKGFWKGGESVRVSNMHPAHPNLETTLPNYRARLFVNQSDAQGEVHFRELNVNADTVWLMPEAQLGFLIFRAAVPVTDPDGRDIHAFMAELEPTSNEALPALYYLNKCLRALSPEKFKHVPDLDSPQAKQTLADLNAAGLLAKVREQKTQFQASLRQAGVNETDVLNELEANPHTRQLAQALRQRKGNLAGYFTEIETLLAMLDKDDASPSSSSSSTSSSKQALSSSNLKQTLTPYPQPGAHAAKAPPAETEAPLHDPAAAARRRTQIMSAHARGRSCAGLDLSHANLAGLDLAGIDLTGAVLSGANFAGTRLQGACLDKVVAPGARFDAADLSGCLLRNASLSHCSFTGAVLRGAQLNGADCSGAGFAGADFTGTCLNDATLVGAWLQGIKAERLMATKAQFTLANLDSAQLPAAQIEGANFSGASAKRSNFSGAVAVKTNWSQCDLSGADLTHADLTASQAGPGSSFDQARLDLSVLESVGWMGASMQQASLQSVRAAGADFSDARLTGAQLTRSDLRQCNFDRADLSQAVLAASNLMQASFIHTNLQSARFDRSNLYNATFVDNQLAGALFDGANLDNTALAT